MQINKIIEAKNIEIYNKGIKSVEGTNFLLKFNVDIDFEKYKENEIYINLDKDYENNFNFSVYKDYDKKQIILCLEGTNKNIMAIIGYELDKKLTSEG